MLCVIRGFSTPAVWTLNYYQYYVIPGLFCLFFISRFSSVFCSCLPHLQFRIQLKSQDNPCNSVELFVYAASSSPVFVLQIIATQISLNLKLCILSVNLPDCLISNSCAVDWKLLPLPAQSISWRIHRTHLIWLPIYERLLSCDSHSLSKYHCFLYFILFPSCAKQESKFELILQRNSLNYREANILYFSNNYLDIQKYRTPCYKITYY